MRIGTPYKQHPGLADHWDAIVIGSGIGGLSTAATLSKLAEKRVLVLERHYTAGGFTQTFRRPGYEWDVGVHYIGDVSHPRADTRRIFDFLTDGELDWADMGEVYDRIILGDNSYDYVKGLDHRNDLAAQKDQALRGLVGGSPAKEEYARTEEQEQRDAEHA